jgi:hypothetical protein
MKKNNLAPIAIFAYKRLEYLKILIHSLKKNNLSKNSIVFIFSDGWKDSCDKEEVLKVRKYIYKISGFKKIILIFRAKNLGLSKNITDGINFVLKKNKKIIVLEEDLRLSKYFLDFINHGLKIYENEKKVASIHGWFYPLTNKKNIPDNFFLRGADCWGWGTWKRSWRKFNPDGKKLLDQIRKKNLIRLFNFNNSYNFFKMLEDQIVGKNDSWAIRWHASMFLENKYTLYPRTSLVTNIGTKNGEHSNFNFLNLNMGKSVVSEKYYPFLKKKVKENLLARKKIEEFFNNSLMLKIRKFIMKIVH